MTAFPFRKPWLEGEWEVTNPPLLGDVIVPELFAAYLNEAVREKMVATQVTNETRDAIKLLREMLRQAERGEVVLTGLRIKNQQPDRWETAGGGAERLRLDNKFTVTLEMHAYDRYAQSQPTRAAVSVDVDGAAMQVLTKPSVDYVTLQGRDPRAGYRLPVQPIKTLSERVLDTIMRREGEYNTLRVSYETRDRLMLDGIMDTNPMASPVTFLGLDLIVEAPDGRTRAQMDESIGPRFDDGLDESEWNAVTPNGVVSARRRTLNEAVTTRKPKPQEAAKPKTPAGASAAREIIFDD